MEFKDRLKQEIIRNGYTQRKLAEETGVTEVTVSRYVKGIRKPNSEELRRICLALKVSSDYLLGINRDMEDYFGMTKLDWLNLYMEDCKSYEDDKYIQGYKQGLRMCYGLFCGGYWHDGKWHEDK